MLSATRKHSADVAKFGTVVTLALFPKYNDITSNHDFIALPSPLPSLTTQENAILQS
jgi:hypothetical protein